MKKSEKSMNIRAKGSNCAQAVFAGFCEDYGIDLSAALKLTAGFGAGMNCGEICGAASGGVLVLGLRYGNSDPSDKEQKKFCGKKTKEFLDIFKQKYSALTCREILATSNKSICNVLIKEVVELLE